MKCKKMVSIVSAMALLAGAFAVPAMADGETASPDPGGGNAAAVDYAIYYSEETGFLKNNPDGEPLTADEIPEGMSAEGGVLTLDNVSFATTKSVALSAVGDITLNIPENSRAEILVTNPEPIDPEDIDGANTIGIQLIGDAVIRADGALSVTARGNGRTFGVTSYGNLTIRGKGEVTASEFSGEPLSNAILVTENLTIEDSAHVYAAANASNVEKNPPYSVVSRQLTVKDDAALDTSKSVNATGIAIWDGYDIAAEGSASIIAGGGIILFGNEETMPGAIRASGSSMVNVKCDRGGDGDNVLDWGIVGAPYGGDDAPADETALVYVADNARVSAYTAAENGGAVSKTKAADGVKVTGGNAEGDNGALEYYDGSYVIPGTEDNALYVLFEPDSSGSVPDPGATAKPDDTAKPLPFTDIEESDWFYGDVQRVYENGLMNGVSDTAFAPDMTLTRGMLATILGRMDGVQSTDTATEYTDVFPDAYYAPYVAWGTENGILNGMGDGTFRPNDPVTREQAAKIIKAYYDYKGEGPTGSWAMVLDYTDFAEVSDWAIEGVMFCTMKGIMTGRDNNKFDPQANITRAECAAVIGRIQ